MVRVYNVGSFGRVLYIESEFIEGGTLGQLIDRETLTLQQKLRIMLGVLRGVSVIHRVGIVHRDIKPSNILIGPNLGAKISDFGMAKDFTDLVVPLMSFTSSVG